MIEFIGTVMLLTAVKLALFGIPLFLIVGVSANKKPKEIAFITSGVFLVSILIGVVGMLLI